MTQNPVPGAATPEVAAEAAPRWLSVNQASWNERVPIHTASEFYDVPAFVAGREALRDFELAEMSDVSGRSLLHLQCHIGTDTLSWARHGAVVTGLDFSEPAVEAARDLAERVGIQDARFVAANVYDALEALGGRTYDVVYTGLGALCWLPDLKAWAAVVAALVKPGGFLYLSEFHPLADILAEDCRTVELDYFSTEPRVWDEPGTYADLGAATETTVSVDWAHTLGEVVSVLIGAGLRLEFLHEHDYTLYPRFSVTERDAGGKPEWRFPAGVPRVPLMYSLRASKPAS
jgi:2-polyprenyl-3-methyl-5-hydroxy-6-metoxy-1,4-benzoquinol methylase